MTLSERRARRRDRLTAGQLRAINALVRELQEERELREWTYDDLARRARVVPLTVYLYEQRATVPTLLTVVKCAMALDLQIHSWAIEEVARAA